jgi:N-acetyl-beta-hexosaminidase
MSWRGEQGGIDAARLGAQANRWTHIARTEEAIEAQIFPRLYALAEVLWTYPVNREYAEFQGKVDMRKLRTWIYCAYCG